MDDTNITEVEKIFKSADFPSQPQIILEINRELSSTEPNFSKIVELVSKDLAMTAKVIRLANSSIYGLRYEVTSIEKALIVLGFRPFANLVVAFALHDALASNYFPEKQLKRFLDHSVHVAEISKIVAQKTHFEIVNESLYDIIYMAGLFHDCGIPLLAKRFPNYCQDIAQGLELHKSLENIEEEKYNCNHCTVGSFMARSWKLPDIVCEAIRYHHHEDISIHEGETLRKILAILIIAENIVAKKSQNEIDGNINLFKSEVSSEEFFTNLLYELDLTIEDLDEIENLVDDIFSSV